MINIRSLGYVGFGAPDPKAWLNFGVGIIGAMPARAVPGESWGMPTDTSYKPPSGGTGIAPDGSVYLKLDDRQWRIGIHPSEDKRGILYMGFELGGPQELEEAVRDLKAAGMPARMASVEETHGRAVMGLAISQDTAGNQLEFFYGPCRDYKFCSPHGVNFKTGDLGVGHLNLFVSDLQAAQDFYSWVLGFKLTDFIRFGPDMSANFYHCNPRHHTLGITRVGPINGIHHLMLEMENIDQVALCLERVEKAGINVTSTLGRHTNDNMLSFYMSSPFGFEVEIGCDGLLVDDSWLPSEFCEGDRWGHKGLDPETIQKAAAQIKQ